MASLRKELKLVHDAYRDAILGSIVHASILKIEALVKRAWKMRKHLHRACHVIGMMDAEKWMLVQLNLVLKQAIIEQEQRIRALEAELLKHNSVLN